MTAAPGRCGMPSCVIRAGGIRRGAVIPAECGLFYLPILRLL
jgi:hypothetical protein